jgi:HEAT repeat protein
VAALPDPSFVWRCWAIAFLLVLLLPALRLVEAIARLILMPSFYDSFSHALTAEMWFSDLWWLYTSTPLGWWVSRALVLWIAAVPFMMLLPWIRHQRAYAFAVAATGLLVTSMITSRLEMLWDGRSQSEWAWRLRSRDPELRRQAAQVLGSLHFRDRVPEGTILLARQGPHDEVLEVRRFAAAFFTGDPAEAVPELTEALADPDDQVRSNAALALAQRGPTAASALPQLKARLNDPVKMVRVHAATAYLAAGGDPTLGVSTLGPEVAGLNSDDRRRLGTTLPIIAGKHPDAAMPLLATPLLATLLRDEDSQVRFYTTLSVCHLGPKAKPLTPTLLLNLQDSDYFVRGSAASALGQIGSPDKEIVAAVLPLLKDPEWWVRRDAVEALGEMGAIQAKSDIVQLLNDRESLVRSGARYALDKLQRRSP